MSNCYWKIDECNSSLENLKKLDRSIVLWSKVNDTENHKRKEDRKIDAI